MTDKDPGEVRRSLSGDVLTEATDPAGHCVVDGGPVIDLSRMRDVVIDPEARMARPGDGSELPLHTLCCAAPTGPRLAERGGRRRAGGLPAVQAALAAPELPSPTRKPVRQLG